MEEKLISKKQLLEKYKISYGALYRWKRKGLIPDDWFIKKSTVTGQETFFPEKLITKRIEKIQSMKDDVLLDELAKKISGEEEKNEYLLIQSHYGDKKIKLEDITAVSAVFGESDPIEITEGLKALFDKNRKKALKSVK